MKLEEYKAGEYKLGTGCPLCGLKKIETYIIKN